MYFIFYLSTAVYSAPIVPHTFNLFVDIRFSMNNGVFFKKKIGVLNIFHFCHVRVCYYKRRTFYIVT